MVGMPDERWGEAPHAFVILRPDASANEDELRQFVRDRMAHFKVPRTRQLRDGAAQDSHRQNPEVRPARRTGSHRHPVTSGPFCSWRRGGRRVKVVADSRGGVAMLDVSALQRVASLLLLTALVACGPASTPPPAQPTSGAAPTAVAAQPTTAAAAKTTDAAKPAAAGAPSGQRGGQVVYAVVGTDVRILNSILQSDTVSGAITERLFDPIVNTDPKTGAIIPQLATRWDSTPDGLTFTFHLRDGVTFHDGQPLTAEDVKFTYDVLKTNKVQTNAHGQRGKDPGHRSGRSADRPRRPQRGVLPVPERPDGARDPAQAPAGQQRQPERRPLQSQADRVWPVQVRRVGQRRPHHTRGQQRLLGRSTKHRPLHPPSAQGSSRADRAAQDGRGRPGGDRAKRDTRSRGAAKPTGHQLLRARRDVPGVQHAPDRGWKSFRCVTRSAMRSTARSLSTTLCSARAGR